MKKLHFLLLAIFTLFISPAFGAEPPPTTSATIKIRLGLIIPLTGPLSFFGKDYVRAYEIAAEDHPELKDKIEFFWEDSAYDSKQAVSAFNKLVSVNKVDAVFSFGGPMLNTLAPIAEAKRIPFFASESAKSDCENKSYCILFRNEEDEWGKATWKVLRKRGMRNIGIIKNQNQFMNTFVEAIVRTKNKDENVEVLLDIPPEMVDLNSSILPLKDKKIDALGVYLLPGSHHGLLRALRSINKKLPLFGLEEFMVKESNAGFEDLINGVLAIAPAAIDSYRGKFESKFGNSPGFFYTPAFYDFCMLLKDTITKEPTARGIELIKALRFTGERSGVSGNYANKVSATGVHSYSFPIAAYKVENGKAGVVEIINFANEPQ